MKCRIKGILTEMKPNPLFNWKLQLAFGSAILALLVVGAMSYRGMLVSAESDRWVRHTHEVLENLQSSLSGMQDIESSSRGFVLTGNEQFLKPYRDGILRVLQEETIIEKLTVDNQERQRQISILHGLADQKIQYAETDIELRRTKGLTAVLNSSKAGEGQRIIDEYSNLIHNMQNGELQLLVLRDADAKRRLGQTKAILIFGSVLGLLIATAAGWSVQRDNSGRRLAEESLRNMVDLKIAEDALFIEKERASVTLNSIGDAVLSTDILGNITYLNVVAEKMTGWKCEEALGRRLDDVFHIIDGASRKTAPNPMEIAVRTGTTVGLTANCILIRRDGRESSIEDSAAPIYNRARSVTGAVIVFHDVTVSRAMSQEMSHLAQYDILTDLPNRLLLKDRISQAIAAARRNSTKVAVLYLDLDGFKNINDSLGHAAGDDVLQSVARLLLSCVRSSDTVSRQGGDEFVVLLSEIKQPSDAGITARKILTTITTSHTSEHNDLQLTASIGLSTYPEDGQDAEILLKNADTAMYEGKRRGPNNYQFFNQDMNDRAIERQSIEADLRCALKRKEFVLHFQPKINLQTGKITSAEALIRWKHPNRGLVLPLQFISVAEESGLILPIGQWVLREACRQAQDWIDAGLHATPVAVNVSSLEFQNEGFLENLCAILRDTRLDPRYLELELTESVLMQHAESSASVLNTLKSIGVRLAVDDFGTGYSSLSYLKKFPIDSLKIDQSFVHDITTDTDDATIVSAVITMAKTLKHCVIAEGVETEEQVSFLQAHGCDEAQGYYFSKPVVAHQFAKLLETGLAPFAHHDSLSVPG
jgi:diguanylate cyclase (GGDEF)-like protein/PAS domain S-box-containing protein